MPVKLNSTGGGSVTLTTPSTASDFTATFPANTGNVVTDSATQTLTNKTLSSPLVMSVSVITSGTEQASTSGTSIDFTSIPSWAKRITVMFTGVSTSGASAVIVQIGISSGIQTTGYLGAGSVVAVGTTGYTTGFGFESAGNANAVRHGLCTICAMGSNVWAANAVLARSDATLTSTLVGAGSVTLSGTLDRVRITTVGGTNTFDAGSINILYE